MRKRRNVIPPNQETVRRLQFGIKLAFALIILAIAYADLPFGVRLVMTILSIFGLFSQSAIDWIIKVLYCQEVIWIGRVQDEDVDQVLIASSEVALPNRLDISVDVFEKGEHKRSLPISALVQGRAVKIKTDNIEAKLGVTRLGGKGFSGSGIVKYNTGESAEVVLYEIFDLEYIECLTTGSYTQRGKFAQDLLVDWGKQKRKTSLFGRVTKFLISL